MQDSVHRGQMKCLAALQSKLLKIERSEMIPCFRLLQNFGDYFQMRVRASEQVALIASESLQEAESSSQADCNSDR